MMGNHSSHWKRRGTNASFKGQNDECVEQRKHILEVSSTEIIWTSTSMVHTPPSNNPNQNTKVLSKEWFSFLHEICWKFGISSDLTLITLNKEKGV